MYLYPLIMDQEMSKLVWGELQTDRHISLNTVVFVGFNYCVRIALFINTHDQGPADQKSCLMFYVF